MEQLIARAVDPSRDEYITDGLNSSCAKEQIIVLANRQPISHDFDQRGRIVAKHSHSGVVHAVEPLVHACSGVWVAHGAGTADRSAVEYRDGVDVPADNPAYRLRRVWLDEEEER